MKLFISYLLAFCVTTCSLPPAFAAANPPRVVVGSQLPNIAFEKNFVKNGLFEKNVVGYTASAGTLAIETGSPIEGTGSLKWTSFTSGDIITSSLYDRDLSLSNENCEIRFTALVGASGNSLDVKVYNNTTSVDVVPYRTFTANGSSNYINVKGVYFQCGTSTDDLQIKIKTNFTAGGTIYIDRVEASKATGIGSAAIFTDWTSYTMTIGGVPNAPTEGAGAFKSARWRQEGPDMVIEFTYHQTAAGSEGASSIYVFPLPSGYTIDTNKVRIPTTLPTDTVASIGGTLVGNGQGGTSSAGDGQYNTRLAVYAYDSTRLFLTQSQGGGAAGSSYPIGSASTADFTSNPFWLTYQARVPILGWTATAQAVRSDQVNYGWTNFGANTIGATTTAPTKASSIVVDTFYGKRVGDSLVARISYRATNGGSAGSGDYLWGIPAATGCTIDTTKVSVFTTLVGASGAAMINNSNVGSIQVHDSAHTGSGGVSVYSTTQVRLYIITDANVGANGSGYLPFSDTELSVHAEFIVPCLNWTETNSAAVFISQPVSARYYASATSVSGSLATVSWTTKDWDSHNAMSSGTYTCPFPGKYQVNMALALSGTFILNNTTVVEIQKNGTAVANKTHYLAAAVTNEQVDLSDIVSCNTGDTIRVQVSNSGTSPAIVSSNTRNFISISKVADY